MKKSKALLYSCILCILSLSMIQCVSFTVVDTSCATYKNETIKNVDFTNSKTAILPVLAGGEWEGFRRPAGDKLYEAFSNKFGRERVLSPLQTLELINQANLSDKYSSLIETYQRAGILNKETLQNLGSALVSDYLIYSRIDNSEQFKSLEAGNNKYIARINEVTFYTQVWDTRKGDICWEGIGGSAAAQQAPGSEVNSLISSAVNGLMKRIGVAPGDQPPCETTDAIVQQYSDQMIGVYLISILAGVLVYPLMLLLL